jgi:hypothetical protein
LHRIVDERHIALHIVGAHGQVRDLLRADGLEEKVNGISRAATLEDLLGVEAR